MSYHEDDLEVLIRRPLDCVVEYVTNPELWSQHHPLSVGVEGHHGRLECGDSVVEHCRIGPLRVPIHWACIEAGSRKFVIRGRTAKFGGASGTITYRFTAYGEFTKFRRVFSYRLGGIGKLPLIRRLITRDGQESLAKVKTILESMPCARCERLAA